MLTACAAKPVIVCAAMLVMVCAAMLLIGCTATLMGGCAAAQVANCTDLVPLTVRCTEMYSVSPWAHGHILWYIVMFEHVGVCVLWVYTAVIRNVQLYHTGIPPVIKPYGVGRVLDIRTLHV